MCGEERAPARSGSGPAGWGATRNPDETRTQFIPNDRKLGATKIRIQNENAQFLVSLGAKGESETGHTLPHGDVESERMSAGG